MPVFRVTQAYLNLLVKPRIVFRFSGKKNRILRILKEEMPFKMHKKFFSQKHTYFKFGLIIGLELAIDPPPSPRGNFVHYDFLKPHYIRHKIKDVSPLRVAALTCNSMLYTLPPKIALNVPDNVSTMTCSYIFAC